MALASEYLLFKRCGFKALLCLSHGTPEEQDAIV